MSPVDTIKFLALTFKKANVPCVLVGGFAVNVYKYSRQTRDIDLLMLFDDREKIFPALAAGGYELFDRKDAFARFTDKEKRMLSVDLLFVDADTLKKITDQGKTVELSGEKFVVPSLEHLIAMKLHAIKQNPAMREFKDLLDIASLVKENGVDIESESFRELCFKYGTEASYRKLKRLFSEDA